MKNTSKMQPFAVKDCTLAAIATGRRAQNLRELRDHLNEVDTDSVYYHFWGSRLRPKFDEPEYNNDFASWSHRCLRDDVMAERLSVIDPRDYDTLDELRQEIIDLIEYRLDEREFVPWAKTDEQFSFIRSQIVVFDTGIKLKSLRHLMSAISTMSTSSIYYHFIDARRRTDTGTDDFSYWLQSSGEIYDVLISKLADVDPYFVTLSDLREQLASVFTTYASEDRGGAT